MKSKVGLSFILSVALILLTKTSVFAQTITSCTVVFITPDCDGCDNKDHDTKLRISVFGAHGYEVATAYYTEDKEFKDNGSENSVACSITDNSGSAAAVAQKIIVTIEPNGNDDWVFEARVIFTLSNGSTTTTKMRERASVSRERPTATLWAGY
jgi:hypothetical protein